MKIEPQKGATLAALADINRIIHKALGVAITYDDWLKYTQNYLIVNNPELKNCF